MADKLVRWLNARGYQPLFMPATDVNPPELYNFSRPRLIRMGTLAQYLPPGTQLPANREGQLPDIQVTQTSSKSVNGAAGFLSNALRCIGITQAPRLDLSFAGEGDVVFKLVDVTYKETEHAEITKLVQSLVSKLIPREYTANDTLHIAYHYAYATKLEMRRADKTKFEGKVSGVQIENFIDLGGNGSVSVANGDALVFNTPEHDRIAFAYKAGQLRRKGGRFELFLEKTQHVAGQAGAGIDRDTYLPSPGVVLMVENE